MRNFRNLKVWQEAIGLVTLTYETTNVLPSDEKYGITSQIRRAAISVPSNIAEGCRGSQKEFSHFLSIALGSTYELETQLPIARNLNYLSGKAFSTVMPSIDLVQKRIGSLINRVKSV